MGKKRVIYLDMLKIISCIAVVIIHVSAVGFTRINIYTASWNVINVLNNVTRFAVLIFVMVSGALFLNDDKQIIVY